MRRTHVPKTEETRDMTKTIAMSPFARGRHIKASRFSYFAGSEAEIIRRTLESLGTDKDKQGYKPGVREVSVLPAGFFSGTVLLKGGEKLVGAYKPRREGEAPRKQVGVVGGEKAPAKAVTIILYSHETLAENDEHSCDADFEIVSINATSVEGDEPMTVGTLLANHFHVEGSNDGGTSTGMTDSELVAALQVSFEYWKDKANVAEEPEC
jgi:hypothetical protein